MYKGLVAEIAKEVGNSAALILNQIYQWYITKNVEKVYRTNEELKSDLENIVSTATIQRCKKRLIEAGYITISFDKGLKRTTHFKLTDKAKQLLTSTEKVVDKIAKKVESVKKAFTKPVAQESRAPSMITSFEKQGEKRSNAIPMPDSIRSMFMKKKDVIETDEVECVSDEEFQKINECIQDEMELQQEKNLTFNELLNKVFCTIPNVDIRESNRLILENGNYFKEDY